MAVDTMTLEQIHGLVRSHAKMSHSAGLNVQVRQSITDQINATQKRLYTEHEWDLWTEHRKTLAAGQRFYDYPTTVRYDMVRSASVEWTAGSNLPVEYGIGINEYNAIDSRAGIRQDPVQRWQARVDTAGRQQFEVWPIPASDDQVFTFTGMMALTRMVAEDDRSVLDGDLIAMFVAVHRLGGINSPEGKNKFLEAKALLNSLRSSRSKSQGGFVGAMGGAPHTGTPGERNVRILVARSP